MFCVCATINHSPQVSLSSLLFYYIKLFYMIDLHFHIFCSVFFFYFLINMQFSHIEHMGRYCKRCCSSKINTSFKNIQWVSIINHKFLNMRRGDNHTRGEYGFVRNLFQIFFKSSFSSCSQKFQFVH